MSRKFRWYLSALFYAALACLFTWLACQPGPDYARDGFAFIAGCFGVSCLMDCLYARTMSDSDTKEARHD